MPTASRSATSATTGTRPDDPNDIVPHEHRRELRGARVFGAWLNHDDSRGVNSLDFLVTEGARKYVKHYMFDFGSILGSGTVYRAASPGGQRVHPRVEAGLADARDAGLYTRPWMHIDYPDVPASIGRFEGDAFDPLKWKPEYPNSAFANMRADDAFWAARIVSRFSDDAIRAMVGKAQYTDPRATDYMTATLIKRRDKVLRTWLAGVNPLVDFAIDGAGVLTFANAAVQASVATPASEYRVSWARFDNATDTATPLGGEIVSKDMRSTVPAALASAAPGEIIQAGIAATHPGFSSWSSPVVVHFRRAAGGWQLIGVRDKEERGHGEELEARENEGTEKS